MHTLLQKHNDTHILLIQEPWFYIVATVHFDNNPKGTPQKGLLHNDMWDAHLPKHGPNNTCKVTIYMCKSLLKTHSVKLHTNHPLANLTSMVMNITDTNDMTLQIINTYHIMPTWGHSLHYLLSHTLDETTPTLLIRDLNTHDPRWSRHNQTPSSWGCALAGWVDVHGLMCLNLMDTLTWFHPLVEGQASTIDLAFANEAALFTGQLGDLSITDGPILLSDHAALSLPFYSLTSLTLIPPPAPRGYSPDPENKDTWMAAFS